jgi:hypothetical protein
MCSGLSLAKLFPTFRRIMRHDPSKGRVSAYTKTVSYHSRFEASSTPLGEPQILRYSSCYYSECDALHKGTVLVSGFPSPIWSLKVSSHQFLLKGFVLQFAHFAFLTRHSHHRFVCRIVLSVIIVNFCLSDILLAAISLQRLVFP